jgi:CRP-like cAMP-binding protein
MGDAIGAAAVRRFPCFQGLGDREAAAVAPLLEKVQLAPGEVLCRQGDAGDAIYLLLSGQAEVTLQVSGQADCTCATLEAGALFGEVGPLLGEARTATVTARAEAEVWRLPGDRLREALARGDAWAGQLLLFIARTLARRLAALNQKLVALAAEMPLAGPAAELERFCSRLYDEELLGLVQRSLV